MIEKLNLIRYFLMVIVLAVSACNLGVVEQDSSVFISTVEPTTIHSPGGEIVQTTNTPGIPLPIAEISANTKLEIQSVVLITVEVDGEKGIGNFDSIYVIEGMPEIHSSGEYAIRFEDAENREIATYQFEVQFWFGEPGLSMSMLNLILPWQDGIARMILLKDNIQLDVRSASAHPPQVNILSPNGGEVLAGEINTIRWSATDLDGDPLEYVVLYSSDNGESWQPVTVDATETTVDFYLESLEKTDTGLVRVLASDGFFTSQDQSDSVFSVAVEKTLFVEIQGDGSVKSGEQTLILDGEAYANTGFLDQDALTFTWSSNLDGVIGEGSELVINALELSEGIHTITLTVRDEDMHTGSSSVTVQIYRFFSSLSVESLKLDFVAKVGDPLTMEKFVDVWHLGNHSLTWFAEADQNWIVLRQAGTETPATLIVSANPAGLAPGTYTGIITITSNAEGVGTHILNVTLVVQ